MSSAADPTATFYKYLHASGLLTGAQLRDLQDWIARAHPDIQALAKEVNRRGWLTPYQIREITKGRAAVLRITPRYALLTILGEGGMGRVYKAHDTRMARDMALKVIRKEKLTQEAAAGRFVQEFQALATMDHPNVVKVFDADEADGTHFYVMEYIDGTDLTKIVRDTGPMPVPEACDAIRQAALGLQHAFERNLVHRDIKPSNILVPRNGSAIKLVDLGLARLMEAPGGEEAHRNTQEGFVIGTPDFLAPEQARNPMTVDIRADIYALGGTLYYLLTGKVPFPGNNSTEKLIKHCTEPPPSLLASRPDAPPPLEQIIHWCMAKRPEDRPQAPIHLAMALHPFCSPWAASAAPPVPSVPAYAPTPAYVAPAAPSPEQYPSTPVFDLPAQSNEADPIRRRAARGFPTGMLLVALGSLLVLGILGYAAYRLVTKAEEQNLDPFTNSQGMKMVRLEGGTFRMGSPDTEIGRQPDEGPVREVTISGPFFMSATEVTISQYLKLMGYTPSKAAKIAAYPDLLPVDNVTWEEANEFCRKLTAKEKNQPWMRKDWAYRLPTEAEWEYAARGGTDTPFVFGDRVQFSKQAVFLASEDDPQGSGGDPLKPLQFGQEVGKTAPNKFGLYDMHGNIAEWCSDWYKPLAYKDAGKDNPTGPADGDKRVIRGGSFRDPASGVRSAARAGIRATEQHDYIGFRVVYAPIK